ncbi:unnamed protein product [Closterium sp. Yama58-4]|nr:unnamed protein product [Closterium sp. Yama58-4]
MTRQDGSPSHPIHIARSSSRPRAYTTAAAALRFPPRSSRALRRTTFASSFEVPACPLPHQAARASRAHGGRGAAQEHVGASARGRASGSRAAGMAEAADYIVPAIAITAATAVTFIAVSFNELREKSAVQQELKQQARLLEEQEGVVLRSSLSSKEKRRARQGKKKGS